MFWWTNKEEIPTVESSNKILEKEIERLDQEERKRNEDQLKYIVEQLVVKGQAQIVDLTNENRIKMEDAGYEVSSLFTRGSHEAVMILPKKQITPEQEVEKKKLASIVE